MKTKFIFVILFFWGNVLFSQNFALRFFGNGVDDIDRVKIPIDNPEKNADVGMDFTIEFQMKANLADNPLGESAEEGFNDDWVLGHVIIDRDIFGPGDYGDYGISLANGRIAFGVNNGTNSYTLIGNTFVADGEWHFIAVTRNQATGELRFFVDGNLDKSAVSGVTGDISYRNNRETDWPNDPYIVLGAEKHDYDNNDYPSYNGFLDELRISDIIRYTENYTPVVYLNDDENTMALYHFDEGEGSIIYDSAIIAGNNSDGVIHFGGTPYGPLWVENDITPTYGQPINPWAPPEYFPSKAVLLEWDFYEGTWELYAQLIREIKTEAEVILVVNNQTEEEIFVSYLEDADINLLNISFVHVPSGRMWIRDHGPIAISTDNGVAYIDFDDYANSGVSASLPTNLANQWGLDVYDLTHIILDGGNFMVDSYGNLFATDRLYTNNPEYTQQYIDNLLEEYLGIQNIYTFSQMGESDVWGHIDMQMKLLDDTTVVISSIQSGWPNHQVLEDNTAAFSQLTTPYGTPYRIRRLPKAENWKSYTNSLIVNNKVIIPIYDHPNDDIAILIYQELLPNHEIVGINANSIVGWDGVIHCITMQLFDEKYLNEYVLSVVVSPENSGNIDGAGYYAAGSEVTVSATPNAGYEFINWTDIEGEEVSANAEHTFEMPAENVELTANFALISNVQLVHKKAITIYPNPTNDVLKIKNAANNSLVIIYDMTGKLILECKLEGEVVNVATLSPGFYTIKIISNNLITTERLIKQ